MLKSWALWHIIPAIINRRFEVKARLDNPISKIPKEKRLMVAWINLR
jgi:hypothetical protein